MSHKFSTPMPRNARVEEHIYAGLSRAELHRAALERVEHYAGTPPDPDLASTWSMLRSAWEWVERKHRRTI